MIARAVTACLLPVAIAAQAPVWHAVASLTTPLAAVWDSARQTTILVAQDGIGRHWEWDGSRARERTQALVVQVVNGYSITMAPIWLADDPRRGRVVGIAALGTIGEWDGARWTWQNPAVRPQFDGEVRFAFDEHRSRIVALQPTLGSLDVYEWDGSQWWVPSPTAWPPTRLGGAFAFDPVTQRCVLYGGSGLADCWSWDGSTWTLLTAAAPPGPRTGAAMVADPGGNGLVLFGDTVASSTWRYAMGSWTQVPTVHTPGPRANARLVRDAAGLLLFGGDDPLGSVWRFDGTDWNAMPLDLAAPALGTRFAAGYDPARGEMVVLDDVPGGGATYRFDTRWHTTTPQTVPPTRNAAGFCWSSSEQLLLLFGGTDAQSQPLGDTWNWTGTDWLARTPALSPPARTSAVMAEDPLGGVLLFGGLGIGGILNDHWHWDGSQWQSVQPAALPPAMAACYGALDPVRGRTVVVGPNQFFPTPPFSSTWEWNGVNWSLGPQVPFSTAAGGRPMAYDPHRGTIVAPGASGVAEWNGIAWTLHASAQGSCRATVTDLVRQRAVMLISNVNELTDAPPTVTSFGNGCAFGPAPALSTVGEPLLGNSTFELTVGTLTANAPAFLVLGFGRQNAALGSGCASFVATPIASMFAMSGAGAQLRSPLPIPNAAALLGVHITAQGAVFDPARSLLGTVTLTAGLDIAIGD